MANITIDELAAEITMAVKEYTDEVSEGVERELDKTSRAVLKDVRANSPVDTGEYKKGWTRKKEASTTHGTKYTIYNKNKGWLAHLLEFGHATVDGGWVNGVEHIAPAYDAHVPSMEARIARLIRTGGG